MAQLETIVAQATPSGRGGVGIIRISGPKACAIAQTVLNQIPKPRHATFSHFLDTRNLPIDQGIALYFPAPHSFTGEDVLELQGHGGPVVLDNLLQRILAAGARLARPGEFSERAFLNNKMDLAQAEAVADLIDAASTQAARSAMRSLQGEFSRAIYQLVEGLIHLRMYVEAAIDFPEEEIDFLSDGKVTTELQIILQQLQQIRKNAQCGVLLRDGMTVVIAGKPNVGKSSLLNCLSGRETAIVTEIAGTTRDILREQILIDGMPLHIIDTAGLRDSDDKVEQEGIRRAHSEIATADCVLWVTDEKNISAEHAKHVIAESSLPDAVLDKIVFIKNKIDLLQENPTIEKCSAYTVIALSAKTQSGIDLLRQHLKACVGFNDTGENNFIARRRHLDALEKAQLHIDQGQEQLLLYRAGELLAEELRQAQLALSEITGEFRADDLLGKIFSSFCIGK